MADEMSKEEYVAAALAVVPARRAGAGFVGEAPDWFGPTLFGGFVLGQATSAVAQTAPDGFALNSFHGYFLAAMRAGVPAEYAVETVRDGRSFAHRALTGRQEGEPFFSMQASFVAPGRTSDFEYGRTLSTSIPRPDELEVDWGGPWEGAWLGPTEPEADGFRRSSMRRWFRFADRIPDDHRLHEALLAYATDTTGQGARPLQMDGEDVSGIVSLDHAVCMHRPARIDEWLFFDVTSTVNTGGRGYLRGQIHSEDGLLVASVTQETLLWDPTKRT